MEPGEDRPTECPVCGPKPRFLRVWVPAEVGTREAVFCSKCRWMSFTGVVDPDGRIEIDEAWWAEIAFESVEVRDVVLLRRHFPEQPGEFTATELLQKLRRDRRLRIDVPTRSEVEELVRLSSGRSFSVVSAAMHVPEDTVGWVVYDE